MSNPYLLPNPSVVSFSGGRTSGFMLHKILDAFGGTLPDFVKVIFCNTGKEREETLAFVERCSQRWSLPITWLEYRWEPGRNYFVEVDFASASRKGEPFEAVIRSSSMLPHPAMRKCTIEMKLKTSNRFVRRELGWSEYTNAIGLRADEPKRVAKLQMPAKHTVIIKTLFGEIEEEEGKDYLPGESPVCPLAVDGVCKQTIMEWWTKNDFDLGLEDGEGNCDLCFLKGAGTLIHLMQKRPQDAAWWIERERERERELSEKQQIMRKRKFALFNAKRPRYEELLAIAQGKSDGPGWLWADKIDGSCGELDECRCTD